MYQPADLSIWTGRISDTQDRSGMLWHQVVQELDLASELHSSIDGVVFIGFCSDEGVRRNLGRTGAVMGPEALRRAMSSLAVHHPDSFPIYDGGNVVLSGRELEFAQKELSRKVSQVLDAEIFPIVLGGGHETSYGHIAGVLNQFANNTIGVINFDPHFDLRTYADGGHSGSWARQLMDEFGVRFQYFPIGINPANNMESMYQLMKQKNMQLVSMDELLHADSTDIIAQLTPFIEKVDTLVVTLDLDVFSGAIAPGVSAPASHGAFSQHILPLLTHLMSHSKTVSLDIAEMNPAYDDGRTAKLAAQMVYSSVMSVAIR